MWKYEVGQSGERLYWLVGCGISSVELWVTLPEFQLLSSTMFCVFYDVFRVNLLLLQPSAQFLWQDDSWLIHLVLMMKMKGLCLKWMRLSNMYISVTFILPTSNNKPASKHPNILCNLGCILATYVHNIVKANISFVIYVCLSVCM